MLWCLKLKKKKKKVLEMVRPFVQNYGSVAFGSSTVGRC